MKIRFLRSWRNKREGSEAQWPDGAANVLIARRIAEQVDDEPQQPRRKRRKTKVKS